MPTPALTYWLIYPLRIIYRQLPLGIRAWLRSRANRLVHQIKDKLQPHNQLALAALIRNRRELWQPYGGQGSNIPIDITIVTYNSARWLTPLFDSLARQRYPLELLAVYVVDNGSSDSSLAMLQDLQQRMRGHYRAFEIFVSDNKGFGTSQNHAISCGNADYILVTNPDLEFESESLLQVVGHALIDDPAVASWELRQKPFEHPKHYDPVTLETNWSSHACVLLRRSVWKAIGGYDENIFMYAEDVEYSYRLRRAGHRLRYCPSSVVWHHTYESTRQVKPAQYLGSLIGNLYIRLRYGQFIEVAIGFALAAGRLVSRQPFEGARYQLAILLIKLLIRTPGILLPPHRPTSAYFPFRGFDYELVRHGAFARLAALPENCPLVSIITRTYRGRAVYLRQAARTVINQTYPNLEWIVVEDGDATLADELAQLQQQTKLSIRHYAVAKAGRSVAGNEGLRQARGELVMFLDDDDLLYADHVEVLANTLLDQPTCVAAYSLAWRLLTALDSADEVIDEHYYLPNLFLQPYCYEVLARYNFIPIQAILFRRSLYLERGGFDVTLDKLEDWNLWLRYGYRNSFSYVPKTTSLYRVPADPGIMDKRQELINSASADAVNSADAWCRRYDAADAAQGCPGIPDV